MKMWYIPPLSGRVESCDRAIEAKFGKPDYSKAFIKNGMGYVPHKGVRLWRIEPLENPSPEFIRERR